MTGTPAEIYERKYRDRFSSPFFEYLPCHPSIKPPIIQDMEEPGVWLAAWREVQEIEKSILGFNLGPRPLRQVNAKTTYH